jgi:hypothetical protein
MLSSLARAPATFPPLPPPLEKFRHKIHHAAFLCFLTNFASNDSSREIAS